MPSGKAAVVREVISKENRDGLQLERTPWNKTGFVNVIEVKGRFQARLQVAGDGRGGSTKRKQYALPGLFDTAEDAAVMLAVIKRDMKAHTGGKLVVPPKQNKPHKPRAKPAVPNLASPVPELPPQLKVATAVALPTAFVMPDLPFAVVSPLRCRRFAMCKVKHRSEDNSCA